MWEWSVCGSCGYESGKRVKSCQDILTNGLRKQWDIGYKKEEWCQVF